MIAEWYHTRIVIGRLQIRFLAGKRVGELIFFSGLKIHKRFKTIFIRTKTMIALVPCWNRDWKVAD